MGRSDRTKQQTLEATLGRPRVRPAIKTPKPKRTRRGTAAAAGEAASSSAPPSSSPPPSFMASSQIGGSARKRKVVLDDSSSSPGPSSSSSSEESSREEAQEEGQAGEQEQENEGQEPVLPVQQRSRGKKRRLSDSSSVPTADRDRSDEDDDDDDKPLAAPKLRARFTRKRALVSDEEDDDEEPARHSSPAKRRRLVRGNAPSSPVATERDEGGKAASAQSPVKARRKRLTAKEKARELLRRKRAGETINEEEESALSEEEAPVKAVYDTDSDHPALSEFEDDEEGVLEYEKAEGKKKKKGKKSKKKKETVTGDTNESADDFIVDDSDEPLGIPAEVYLDMPLQFTSHSHKPLKEHFRDVVEWLVQSKVNPGFAEKDHELYRMAWRKLDDEVRGLAQSKFASSAWRPDFTKALRARPYFTNQELGGGSVEKFQKCGACGRSNHPASWAISFSGTPYYKDFTQENFLEPVEADSDSESGSRLCDVDEAGNDIPEESKQWFVGVVCNSNAETAHGLMHWKHALLDWVDARLHKDGYMLPDKLAERERMRPKQKYKLVDEILKRWVDDGTVKALYQDFKGTIEQARNKTTTGRYNR